MISTITAFEAIPIDKISIPQCNLDIENKTRSNMFAWNGQFSPQFIETLLSSYAHDEDIVLDPFAGSGTTLCEAGRKGLSAYGMELNASAYYMAKTYELINRTISERQSLIFTIEHILATISGLNEITYRAMMGEFVIYYRGKIVGGIYDDRLLVKPVKSAISYMPTVSYELPYEGAKEMLLVDEVDNKEFLTGLFNAMYEELPTPKSKKKK
ncbi:MAG: hypothetical protein K1W04_07340 [Oscillospiraceae bacterium]